MQGNCEKMLIFRKCDTSYYRRVTYHILREMVKHFYNCDFTEQSCNKNIRHLTIMKNWVTRTDLETCSLCSQNTLKMLLPNAFVPRRLQWSHSGPGCE